MKSLLPISLLVLGVTGERVSQLEVRVTLPVAVPKFPVTVVVAASVELRDDIGFTRLVGMKL